ncbi:MAG: hypothetical protein SGJ05_03425 [bacterium]|nr:hypothetical protein [bacterium]
MAEFSIESNGRIEKTAIYYNGEQLKGVQEIVLNLDENGTFDAVLQYMGSDKTVHTKQVFSEYLDDVQVMEPSFSEEEAQSLKLLSVHSDGNIEGSSVFINNEEQNGIVRLYVHIKVNEEFKAEITFREEDGTLTTEGVF